MTMKLPIITSRRDVEVRIVGGQSVLELFQQVRNVLLRELPDAASLFAEPIVNPVRDEIAWSTRLVGEIRCVKDLPPGEFTEAIERLEGVFASLTGLIERLSSVGRGSGGGGDILRAMMVTPGLAESVFLVGNALVLTQWGCYTFGSPESSADIFKEIYSLKPSPVSPREEPGLSSDQTEPTQTLQTQTISSVQESSPRPGASSLTEGVEKNEAEADLQSDVTGDLQRPNKSLWLTNLWPFLWWVLAALLLLLVIGIFFVLLNEFDRKEAERLTSEVSLSKAKVIERAAKCRESSATGARDGSVTSLEMWSRRYEAGAPDAAVERTNVSLAWDSVADLDLIIRQPDGQTVYFGRVCRGDSCGVLDVDANRCGRTGSCNNLTTRPLENISWSGAMLQGRYEISVLLYDIHPSHALKFPVKFTVEVLRQGKRETKNGAIEKADVRCGERCTAIASQFHTFSIE